MESYIVINGKKAPLTEEQLKMLGITTEKNNPFARCKENEKYYFINPRGETDIDYDDGVEADDSLFAVANYCTDENLLQQRAWHETLSRLLWRYSMEHDGDKIDWEQTASVKFYIYKDQRNNMMNVSGIYHSNDAGVYFHTAEVAKNAIKEIVEPFMAEHPDFVW